MGLCYSIKVYCYLLNCHSNLTAQLLLQGSPCHIYFDLEFDTRLNKNRDADEMVDILVAVVFSALRDKYSIKAQEDWITELDSSTEGVSIMFLLDRITKSGSTQTNFH